MKQLSKIQLDLLHQLADGQCHSGSAIGDQLGISRAAVWKHVGLLAELGLPIKRIPQQGYQLPYPLIPLDEQSIRHYLNNDSLSKPVNMHVFASLGSTNQFLKELAASSTIELCCAEKQTHGRGRFGRQWISPFGENIYFSSRWELNCCLSRLSGLSLVVGLAILASLKSNGVLQAIGIKWPNDLLWNGRKLCGILIEVIAETNSCAQVIIGIGMNVNAAMQLENQSWCSLHEITGTYFNRNRLIAHLIQQLDYHLQQFLTQGFATFASDWQRVDCLQGQAVTVTTAMSSISGIACGVNEFGLLALRDERGKIHYLSSGDTSLAGKI